jgi:hypothetical protein
MSDIQEAYNREGWYTRYWRATLAWAYIIICLFDFVIGPLFYAWFAVYGDKSFGEWEPLTLSNAGVFHISMGAILGVSSWSRGQEKMKQMDLIKGQNGD